MTEYLGRVDAILDNLKSLGDDVNESTAITKFISSLAVQYQHFISAWESMPADRRKMDELTSRLLVEEQPFKARVEEEGSRTSTTFQMEKAGKKSFTCECKSNIKKSENANNKFQSRVNKGVKYCQWCKMFGHNLNECWFTNKSGRPITSNAFQVYVMPAINSGCASDYWVMDSGASKHMSHDKHIFNNYKEL
ncbi:hypothetical protein PR048_012132 [Dryococelus australis]|uniref:Uncharacterized protein n=1 Tax=Dryococelus australis TaxID=614101 RepID=A0ABQ9HNK8_9NEOP|nr:hypothetical protein PR048_012132 [Dryococelus australis]